MIQSNERILQKKWFLGKVNKQGDEVQETVPKSRILSQKWIQPIEAHLEGLCVDANIPIWARAIAKWKLLTTSATSGLPSSLESRRNIPTGSSSAMDKSISPNRQSKKRKTETVVEESDSQLKFNLLPKVKFEDSVKELETLLDAPIYEKSDIRTLKVHQTILLKIVKMKEKIKLAMRTLGRSKLIVQDILHKCILSSE